MFGGTGLGVQVPMPDFPALGLDGSDKSYYYLCLVLTILVTGVVIMIGRSRLGRLSRALADSPRGLATTGTSINVTRVLVFCLSAFLAAIAGVLAAGAIGQASGDYVPADPVAGLLRAGHHHPRRRALVRADGGGRADDRAVLPDKLSTRRTGCKMIFGVAAIGYAMTPASPQGHAARSGSPDRPARSGARPAGTRPSHATPRPAVAALSLSEGACRHGISGYGSAARWPWTA